MEVLNSPKSPALFGWRIMKRESTVVGWRGGRKHGKSRESKLKFKDFVKFMVWFLSVFSLARVLKVFHLNTQIWSRWKAASSSKKLVVKLLWKTNFWQSKFVWETWRLTKQKKWEEKNIGKGEIGKYEKFSFSFQFFLLLQKLKRLPSSSLCLCFFEGYHLSPVKFN